MNNILKKFKLNLPLIYAAGILLAAFSVFTAVNTPDVSVRTLESAEHLQDFPEIPAENISHKKYALQKIYGARSIFRSASARKGFNPIPPAHRTLGVSTLPHLLNISIPSDHYFDCAKRSYFHQYIKYALPRRAGPFEV